GVGLGVGVRRRAHHLRDRRLGRDALGTLDVHLRAGRGRRRVDDLDDDVARVVVARDDLVERLGRRLLVGHLELAVEVELDGRALDDDLDVVRLAGLDAVVLDGLHLVGAPARRALEGLAGVVPAAEVPPVVVVRAARGEADEEALGAGGLARVELERVTRPVLRVRTGDDRPGVGDVRRRLHVGAVLRGPRASLQLP